MHLSTFTFILALVSSTVALPLLLDVDVEQRDIGSPDFNLERRQALAVLGGAARTAGKAAGKAPEKAGKSSAKEQAGNAGKGGENKKSGDTMAKNIQKHTGKEQDKKCVEGQVEMFTKTGGANGSWNCDKPDAKTAAKNKQLDDAKKKAAAATNKGNSNGIGAKTADARAKAAAAGKKK